MNIRPFGIAVLVAVMTGAGACPHDSTAVARVFKAGAAASNITPPLDEPIVGGWGSPLATHIHDELYARCLVLDDGERRLVFVLVDSLGMAREVFDAAKGSIREKTGIPKENMLTAATHTHSSISARGSSKVKG